LVIGQLILGGFFSFVVGKYIYEGRLFVCFVCHVEITMLGVTFFYTRGKPLMNMGALSWFHNVLTFIEEVIEY